MKWCIVLMAVLVVAWPAYGSILGQPNDAKDPGFELGPVGGQSPNWEKTAGGGNVRIYDGAAFGAASPDGGQKYGSASSWGTDSGRIEQYFVNPEPDEWIKTVAIGGWVYAHSFDQAGAPVSSSQVRFSLHMDPDPIYQPNGLDLVSDWFVTGDQWQWQEWIIEDLPCKDFIVDIEFQQMWGVAWNLTFADGIDVEHICIPEPSALALMSLTVLPLIRFRRRR